MDGAGVRLPVGPPEVEVFAGSRFPFKYGDNH